MVVDKYLVYNISTTIIKQRLVCILVNQIKKGGHHSYLHSAALLCIAYQGAGEWQCNVQSIVTDKGESRVVTEGVHFLKTKTRRTAV